jgi:hypothetical protein
MARLLAPVVRAAARLGMATFGFAAIGITSPVADAPARRLDVHAISALFFNPTHPGGAVPQQRWVGFLTLAMA